jgi:hypothetical protein
MNNFKRKTADELAFIIRDAGAAAINMKLMGNAAAEAKYLDQVNDASTELYRRRKPADSVSYHRIHISEIMKGA